MNLLIVDDEYYSVDGIRSKLDWPSLGIENVFCAYSMEQAQGFFKEQKIDIMLSDIEMPKGSGLELLNWIRQMQYPTVCLFLTSYARFDYASQALKLESIDYLLKPADYDTLLSAMQKAIAKVQQLETEKLQAIHAEYWDKSRIKLAEQFWSDLASQVIPPVRSQVQRVLTQLHLPQSWMEGGYYPVLLQCRLSKDAVRWERNLFEYAVKNILNELLFSENETPVITRAGELQYLIILNGTRTRDEVFEKCRKAIETLTASLPASFNFFAGGYGTVELIGEMARSLLEYARNNIRGENAVYDIEKAPAEESGVTAPPLVRWNDLLVSRRTDQLQWEAEQYLSNLQRSHNADRRDLVKFYHNFLQIVYSILERSGESAHKLFLNNASDVISEHACDSVDTMRSWLQHTLAAFNECMSVISQSSSPIETVKQYIREHLSEDLSRNSLAAVVYLSPDYLSHTFREKAGISLTEYITAERIRKAKELLLLNRSSIRDVALLTGFQNISYFSKQFKRSTGKTPQEFRKG